MDITGTYHGLAPDGNLVCWREIEMTIDKDSIRFRAAGDDDEVEDFSVSLAETQPMTSSEIAELFDEDIDLSSAYGLFLGDKSEGVILFWEPIVPGWEGPRIFKRNLVEDEMSAMLRWGFFDAHQVANGQLESAIDQIKPSVEEFTGEEVRIIRLPSTK